MEKEASSKKPAVILNSSFIYVFVLFWINANQNFWIKTDCVQMLPVFTSSFTSLPQKNTMQYHGVVYSVYRASLNYILRCGYKACCGRDGWGPHLFKLRLTQHQNVAQHARRKVKSDLFASS